jgi:hypothetical protein
MQEKTVMELTASKLDFDGTATMLIAPDFAYGRHQELLALLRFLLHSEHHRSCRGGHLESHVGCAFPGQLLLTGLIVVQKSICRRSRCPSLPREGRPRSQWKRQLKV